MWLIMVLYVVLLPSFSQDKISPELKYQFMQLRDNDYTSVIVQMQQDYPFTEVQRLSFHDKAQVFKTIAQTSQQSLINYLQKFPDQVRVMQTYWIFNGMHVTATQKIIASIAQREDVKYVSTSDAITLLSVEEDTSIVHRPIEWNIERIMADSCWVYGYTGDSMYVALLFGGVDTTHSALQGNISPWYKAFGNPGVSLILTHHAGIICGGDGLGPYPDDIGVAPKAQLVIAAFDSSQYIDSAMQWIAELKADSGVNIRAANCPWGSPNKTDLRWWIRCEVWRSLDILPVFSVGSLGPSPSTAGTPGNYPIVMGVGGTRTDDNIMGWSSRGPAPDTTPWNEPSVWYRPDWNLRKPDIAVPAQNIRSCSPGGGFITLTGTSIPHITGAVAIICEKNPGLTVTEVYNLILDNADHPPQGAPYPNNNYGWGRLNIWKAIQAIPGVEEAEKKIVNMDQIRATIINGPLQPRENRNWKIYNICGQAVDYNQLSPGIYFIKQGNKIIRKIIKIK